MRGWMILKKVMVAGLWLVASMVLLIVLIASPFIIGAIIDQYTLHQLERQIKALEHPADTALVKAAAVVGDMGGSDDICVLFAGELRQFRGEKQALNAFYANKGVTLWFIENGIARTDVLDVLPYGYYDLRWFSKWGDFSPSEMKDLYIVSKKEYCRITQWGWR